MTDYTTRITASRNKIYQLSNNLLALWDMGTSEQYYKQATIHEMLANEYRELAKVLEDMERKELNRE